MKKNLITAILMTVTTSILLGVVYPLVVTVLAQALFHDKANGELIIQSGKVIGSRLIGQSFASDRYFHSRLSSAGNGYDAANSAASNLGPTNRALIERVNASVTQLHQENPNALVPIDLVTSSGSGLDPDITPAAAEFQIPRVSRARNMNEAQLRSLIAQHTKKRQLRFLGEPRVNVLELSLELDSSATATK
ncbi:MAG: potassium-transporting ATPase subunit KdpC [Acidobacteria bacterium]|nr:potassium-transporting ATPase subunit KdpC [Acidobacteriota bacterium]